MPLNNLQIAEVASEAVRVHYRLATGQISPVWKELPDYEQRLAIAAVEFLRTSPPMDGPAALYNFFMGDDFHTGFDNAPLEIQEAVFLFRNVVIALTGWVDDTVMYGGKVGGAMEDASPLRW